MNHESEHQAHATSNSTTEHAPNFQNHNPTTPAFMSQEPLTHARPDFTSDVLPPAQQASPLQPLANEQPVAVVQTLSVRGIEYTMMTLPLWIAAASLLWLLLSVVNGSTDFSLLAFPAALLIVCLPIFAFFFVRLRRAELANPALRFDPSKRRLTQFTQIFTYATCLFNLIAYVYIIMQKLSGETGGISIGKATINLLIIFVVAGGILAYYWFDEHKNFKA